MSHDVTMKNILVLLFILSFSLISCKDESASPVLVDPSPAPVVVIEEQKGRELSVYGTLYYSKILKSSSTGIPLRDMSDKVIGPKLAPATWCLAAIEGTASIDGQVYNYAGKKLPEQTKCSHAPSGQVRWTKSKYKYGIGNFNNPLRPFISVAVDNSLISKGSKIYIPEAKGIKYTFEGKEVIHDGIFYADDTGGLIKGAHFDFFIGEVEGGVSGALKINPFPFVKSDPSKKFKVYILD